MFLFRILAPLENRHIKDRHLMYYLVMRCNMRKSMLCIGVIYANHICQFTWRLTSNFSHVISYHIISYHIISYNIIYIYIVSWIYKQKDF